MQIKTLFKRKAIFISIVVVIVIIGLGILGYYSYVNIKYNSYVTNAQKSFKNDKFDEAAKYYSQALKYKDTADTESKLMLSYQMDGSLNAFNLGNQYMNSKDYFKAYSIFKSVLPEDTKRYKTAQEKSKESSKLYIDKTINDAKDSVSKGNLDDAISKLNSLLTIDTNNVTVNNLLSQYQQTKSQQSDALRKAEEEKQKQEQQKQQQDAINNARDIIRVKSIATSEPNSASGVDLYITWTNNSNKTIKYITFKVTPYNAVGDAQYCNIRNYSEFSGKVTGPINAGQTYGDGGVWSNAWYNSTIKNAKLNEIDIIYMDNSTATIDSNTVGYVLY